MFFARVRLSWVAFWAGVMINYDFFSNLVHNEVTPSHLLPLLSHRSLPLWPHRTVPPPLNPCDTPIPTAVTQLSAMWSLGTEKPRPIGVKVPPRGGRWREKWRKVFLFKTYTVTPYIYHFFFICSSSHHPCSSHFYQLFVGVVNW